MRKSPRKGFLRVEQIFKHPGTWFANDRGTDRRWSIGLYGVVQQSAVVEASQDKPRDEAQHISPHVPIATYGR